MTNNPYNEAEDAQATAQEVLDRLGYHVVSRDESKNQRGGNLSRVILRDVLVDWLKANNEIEYRGQTIPFSDANIQAAVDALERVPDKGVVYTNEEVYDLLVLGKSFEQQVDGARKSFQVRYVDWDRPERNVYHVVREFDVRGPEGTVRPMDAVGFVNGIPFIAIECKRRDDSHGLTKAVHDLVDRYEEMPRLFWYVQLAFAVNVNGLKYGTAGTTAPFFSLWREDDDLEPGLKELLGRTPTVQDLSLYALCRPERLLEMTRHFVLFDGGDKKVARHQQYFAVKRTIARVHERDRGDGNCGGIIWHTQGSGKSITMVFLFEALARVSPGARVILVTDRVNLDDQIEATFTRANLKPHRAKSSKSLLKLIRDEKVRVITTVIDKFISTVDRDLLRYDGGNLFVLVDEGHRSQYGTKHAKMRQALPNACYIAFTGTPIVERQKNILRRFGPFIHRYTLREATEDEAVVPLLYESRFPELSFNEDLVDRHFDRMMTNADSAAVEAAKQWATRKRRFYESQQLIEEIAYHVSEHYFASFRDTGFKGQLAVPLKDTAVRYWEWFQQTTDLRTAVVISPPGEPEDDPYALADESSRVQAYWDQEVEKFSTPDAYEKYVVDSFKYDPDGVELLIVVGKLLTGFDAPCNTVLYIAKPLSSHTLLQAIARVNRVFPGKDFGYIVDYYDILGNLDQAMTEYEALAGYDEADLVGTLTNVRHEVDELPSRHSRLLDVFRQGGLEAPSCDRRTDPEPYERYLYDQAVRDQFYERLSEFSRTLQLALSSLYYHETTKLKAREDVYRCHLQFFQSLRRSIQTRYGERTDFKEYQVRIRKLMDRFVHATDIVPLTERPVNIFDSEDFLREIERMGGTPASKADTIAHQVRRVLTLRMDENPAAYRRFSEVLQEAIDAFHDERIAAQEYLDRVKGIYDDLVHGSRSVPRALRGREEARAYYSSVCEAVKKELATASRGELSGNGANLPSSSDGDAGLPQDVLAEAAVAIENIISRHKIVDWTQNSNVEAAMRNAIEDYLLGIGDELGVALSFGTIDLILEDVMKIARKRAR